MNIESQALAAEVEALIAEILQSPKYREMQVCEETLRDLLYAELPRHKRKSEAVKAAKKKLHNVVAPYLGDPDYGAAREQLDAAFASGDPLACLPQAGQAVAVRDVCARIMMQHASTRERLPILGEFYRRIFDVTGEPRVLLDIACGLNPFSFPWMGLPVSLRYHAYDIRRERIALINEYFALQGLAPLAKVQDVLVELPHEEGDIALLLKEVHRLEQRDRGSSLRLLDALRVRHVVVSLPNVSLGGQRDLATGYRRLFENIAGQRPWHVTEISLAHEMVFCVDKLPPGSKSPQGVAHSDG